MMARMPKPQGSEPNDPSEFRAVHALRDAVPTRAHAEMLFGQVVDLLGDAASVESWNGESTRTLYRREAPGSRWVLPWPLLSVTRGGREGPSPILTAIPGVYLEPKVRPGPAPRVRGLGPGQIEIHDGPHRIAVTYGADGRWFECSCSDAKEALAGIVPALAARNAAAVELVASFVAALDVARHGPGRVHLPVPLPGGAQGVWNCGLFAIRDALFAGRVPPDARWVAADGWTGRALAWGATREAAIDAWRGELARVRPFPEKPKAPEEPLPEPSVEQTFEDGRFSFRATLRGPSSDVPSVEPTLENSPAAVLPLGELPASLPSLGMWTRLVGSRGAVHFAALRRDRDGFTMVGDRVLDTIPHGELDARLDAADREWDARPIPQFERPPGFPEPPPTDCEVRHYRLLDEKTGAATKPSVGSSGRSTGFHARGLDGDRIRMQAVRMRRDR